METSEQIKQREQQSWNSAAPIWRREEAFLIENTAVVSERLMAAAGIASGQRVLDIACGTGEPALRIARAVGASGEVVATDLAADMLAHARDKAASQGFANVSFHNVDGETLEGVTGPFAAATSRWGIMFMPEPLRCLQRVHGLLAPGGRMAVATWGPPPRNPFISIIMGVLRRHFELPAPPPDAPGIFAFADENRLRRLFEEAGFSQVGVEEIAFAMRYRSPEHFYDLQTGMAAPIRDLLAKQSEDKRAEVRREVIAEAEKFRAGEVVEIAAMAWVASGAA